MRLRMAALARWTGSMRSPPAWHCSGGERALAVIDHGDLALLQPAAERDDVLVDPHVRQDGFAWVDWRGEAHVEAADQRMVVLGDLLENGPAGRAVRAQAMQDWHRETDALRQL